MSAFRISRLFAACVALLVSVCLGAAEAGDWPDGKGGRFRGEPASVFGPFALFRTKSTPEVKRVPLRMLTPDECRRFQAATANVPVRASRWIDAQSAATRELIGSTQRLVMPAKKFVEPDFATQPEPELLLAFYGHPNLPGAWLMLNNIGPNFQRVKKVYPGLVEGVFYGLGQAADQHEEMAVSAWMPWLVTKITRQGQLGMLRRIERTNTALFAILTRTGDPLLIIEPGDLNTVRSAVDELVELAWLMHPSNVRAWADVQHYRRAVRPMEFAQSRGAPEMIGNPLRPDGLRSRGLKQLRARLAIDAEGKVTAVDVVPDPLLTEKLTARIAESLKRGVFAPAIEQGAAVAASFDYVLEIPSASPQDEADAAWVDRSITGQLYLRDWLLLTSLPVPEQSFTEVQSVGPDGKVRFTDFEVSTNKVTRSAQANAFNTNFFDATGAGEVAPKLGQTETIEGRTLTWRAVKSLDGYVDLTAGQKDGATEYCVGYAWTELEVPADMTAWLGIGSDDGLKVWLNGELVDDRWLHRISHLDDDVVPVKLKAGKNRILLKVQNKTRNWSFIARLRFREK